MKSDEKLQVVFTGSHVDAGFVKALLMDNGIGCIIKDPYSEGIIAGYVPPGSENGAKVLVEQKNYIRASYLVEKFVNESNNNEEE